MSAGRKGSLKHHQMVDFTEEYSRPNSSRQRKQSVNLQRANYDEVHSNLSIHLDEKLTNKLVFVKRVEKMEKEAIRYFYDNKIEQCFDWLEKCLGMMEDKRHCQGMAGFCSNLEESGNFNLPQHHLYIRYLQAEFNYKLKNYQLSRQYYEKAMKICSRLNRQDKQKSSEYILSLSVLHCSLFYEEGKYQEVIKSVDLLEKNNFEKLSQKMKKQIELCKIQSYANLKQSLTAIELSKELLSRKTKISQKQECKIIGIMCLCLRNVGKIEQAEEVIENYLQKLKTEQCELEEDGNKKQGTICRVYQNYYDLFAHDVIKSLHICKRWALDCEYPDPALIKLFHLYYAIGDFDNALSEYAEISDSYKRTSEDWEAIAEIKLFFNQKQFALFMLEKALQLAKTDDRKLLLEIKIYKLTFEQSENRKEDLKNLERKMKDFRHRNWIQEVVNAYKEFLEYVGEGERVEKVRKYFEEKRGEKGGEKGEMLETGKFGTDIWRFNEKENSGSRQIQKMGRFSKQSERKQSIMLKQMNL